MLFGGDCTWNISGYPTMKPSRKPAGMKGKQPMTPACLSTRSHASALYGVGGEHFLSLRAVTGTVGEGATTRAHMHVVMLLMASTLPLPEATQCDSPFSGMQSLVDPFGVGVVLIVTFGPGRDEHRLKTRLKVQMGMQD